MLLLGRASITECGCWGGGWFPGNEETTKIAAILSIRSYDTIVLTLVYQDLTVIAYTLLYDINYC